MVESQTNLNESSTFSGVIYNVLKSIPVIYSPSEIKYSPIILKLEGASLTGKTSALNDTTVESIPPPSVPPSSLTVIVIKEDPNLFSAGFKLNCSGEDSRKSISGNKSELSASAAKVIF